MNPVAITLVVRLLVGVSTPSCGVAIHCILKHTQRHIRRKTWKHGGYQVCFRMYGLLVIVVAQWLCKPRAGVRFSYGPPYVDVSLV
jgi:hypothetical protein